MKLKALTACALALSANLAHAAQAGVWQWWTYGTTEGLYNIDKFVTIRATGPTRFFAHQLQFMGGDGAYLGLQDTPNGRLAIFSVWNSPGDAVAGRGASCSTFGGEGEGWHCLAPYPWKTGHTYRYRVWQTASKPDGSTQWVAAIDDVGTGKGQQIGYLWTAPNQGLLAPSSVSWIEDYGMESGHCATEKPAKAVFFYPTADAAATRATPGLSETSSCGKHKSVITLNNDGTVLLSE